MHAQDGLHFVNHMISSIWFQPKLLILRFWWYIFIAWSLKIRPRKWLPGVNSCSTCQTRLSQSFHSLTEVATTATDDNAD